ncbi:MAG: zf-HC2 domain-containing protein [Planctomycetes bacterium]|nr:zf-HC2 domain-containing protein [Planctomycetota bacterium]
MDCKKIRPLLDLHAGDDLDGHERIAVDVHLRGCLACFREFAEMRSLVDVVRATTRDELRSEAAGESIVAGIMGAIHGPPPAAPRLLPRLLTASGWAAAVLLAGTLGVSAWSDRSVAPSRSNRASPQIVEGDAGLEGLPLRAIGDEIDRQLDELHRGSRRTPLVPVSKPAVRRNM